MGAAANAGVVSKTTAIQPRQAGTASNRVIRGTRRILQLPVANARRGMVGVPSGPGWVFGCGGCAPAAVPVQCGGSDGGRGGRGSGGRNLARAGLALAAPA